MAEAALGEVWGVLIEVVEAEAAVALVEAEAVLEEVGEEVDSAEVEVAEGVLEVMDTAAEEAAAVEGSEAVVEEDSDEQSVYMWKNNERFYSSRQIIINVILSLFDKIFTVNL